VKQSQSFPHKGFPVATKPDGKITRATIGYNEIASSQQQLALQFATTMKKTNKQTNKFVLIFNADCFASV